MLLDLFFPNRCLHCNRKINGNEVICEICYSQISFTHWDFSKEHILYQKCNLLFPINKAYALMHFEKDGLTQKIIHDLKYKRREKIGKTLAQWTMERIDLSDKNIDLIITVPLHPKKQNERGYNQLHLFANELSKHFKIPHQPNLLKRNYYKKAQALKNRLQRSETESLFSVTETIDNQHLLIIDDVFTTGNTISSVAWELLKSGNNKISVLVMAMD